MYGYIYIYIEIEIYMYMYLYVYTYTYINMCINIFVRLASAVLFRRASISSFCLHSSSNSSSRAETSIWHSIYKYACEMYDEYFHRSAPR